tara:strand:+ start:762 stop:1721 length:960 start_codon:yes stop_codon:yes gene_type:complete
MAGLIRNKTSRSLPQFPKPYTGFEPYYGAQNTENAYHYFPAFAGGTAGRSLRVHFQATGTPIKQYNIDGTVVETGIWDAGMNVQEAAGNAAADRWAGFFMDETDQMLYMLTTDTSTSPHTAYFSKVNEAGVATAIGSQQFANTDIGNFMHYNASLGHLRRDGGDGSGNFSIDYMHLASATGSAAAPYRGTRITINATNGSLSYADIFPNTYGAHYSLTGTGVGPTANNIIVGFYAQFTSSSDAYYGSIANTSNGKGYYYVELGTPSMHGLPQSSSTLYPQRWRGQYAIANYAHMYAPANYAETDLHTWADQLGEYYGIL